MVTSLKIQITFHKPYTYVKSVSSCKTLYCNDDSATTRRWWKTWSYTM